jgi:hypothetical protein
MATRAKTRCYLPATLSASYVLVGAFQVHEVDKIKKKAQLLPVPKSLTLGFLSFACPSGRACVVLRTFQS